MKENLEVMLFLLILGFFTNYATWETPNNKKLRLVKTKVKNKIYCLREAFLTSCPIQDESAPGLKQTEKGSQITSWEAEWDEYHFKENQ